jgi:hypothetical protein
MLGTWGSLWNRIAISFRSKVISASGLQLCMTTELFYDVMMTTPDYLRYLYFLLTSVFRTFCHLCLADAIDTQPTAMLCVGAGSTWGNMFVSFCQHVSYTPSEQHFRRTVTKALNCLLCEYCTCSFDADKSSCCRAFSGILSRLDLLA